MALVDGLPSVILSNVAQLIQQKVPAATAPLVKQFAELLYKNISTLDLDHRNDSDMYGATLSLWNTLNDHQDDKPVIKVFNPQVSKNGWKSSHTIIEIIVRDMPFLVDSVRIALSRLNLTPHLMLNSPIKIIRDRSKNIKQLSAAADQSFKSTSVETVFFIEIDRQNDAKVLSNITKELHSVVSDIAVTVNDWQPMQARLRSVIKEVKQAKALPCSKAEHQDSISFLEWMLADNFTLLGYRSYHIKILEGDMALSTDVESSLGLMNQYDGSKERLISSLSESARKIALGSNLLILTKTNAKSRVHRPAHLDYIGVKRFDEKGNVIGEERFVGLFGSAYYTNSALDLPLIKSKVIGVCNDSGFAKGTHAYKALINILETYPRDEILQSSPNELLKNVMGIFQMQERDYSGLFMRRDAFDRFYSCMVYVPRERYNTALRINTQKLLQEALGSKEEVEFTTYFSESAQARTHYIVRVNSTKADINVKEIEKNLNHAARSWDDNLADALNSHKGEAKGKALSRKYASFPQAYKDEVLPGTAIVDIEKFEALSADNQLEMLFYQPQEEDADSRFVKLKLFHSGEPLHLSDVLPMLENFGLRVIGESPYAVKTENGEVYWILDFSMLLTGKGKFNLEIVQSLFQDAFAKVWSGRLEDDGFNRLILGAELGGREVSIVRAYAKYERQIGGTFSQNYIEDTFARYPSIAKLLIKLFNLRFSPAKKINEKAIEKVLTSVESSLDSVANLDDDRIIRRFVEMINATIRTNYFQPHPETGEKSYISFKILPAQITDVPLPLPKFEIFVYSPQVEGVHLRGGKVARGGLRWSDRREDFRTEVLGLVKAQQVKNTVIVPVGAKGGFVCKQLPNGDRNAIFEAGKECYRTFIRGLLDITDNIVAGEIVPPVNVVRHDEDDPYLVVAADKGTATFSDIANSISDEFNFWLGDAFASGGSVGYDHKGMGITARGAWESVKRHFREMDIDCQTTDFTVVGIGDMAGDVFGNGMLLSKHIRLQAAFNHLHIFIDPTPDAATTYVERERLFNLPGCSWEDFDMSLVSEGGGLFNRSAKSIKLTPQIKKMIGTQKQSMAPNDLIQALLKMKVDLLWNGGIGTYVKGSKETHLEVGDRANDSLRINGVELQAKVVGEGGNLGLTHLGRIEFAAKGGRINADFVDNAGGVDCSDNEVNIKVLLNGLVQNGDLTVKQRNKILYDMTDEVGDIVIEDCYRQTHSLSITELRGGSALKEQAQFITELERAGKLDRALEFIPSDEEIAERLALGKGLTRPELSVLLAYSKMVLKEELVCPEITDNEFHQSLLIEAFPKQLQDNYSAQMQDHPLRAEIIATKLANNIGNDMGFNFVNRMREETGATTSEIANCYAMASAVFELSDIWKQISDLDNKISTAIQTEMLFQLRRTVRRATRWFLRHRNKSLNIAESIEFYHATFAELSNNITSYMVEDEATQIKRVEDDLIKAGAPKSVALRISLLSTLFSVMDLAEITKSEDVSTELATDLYFKLGARLELHWFLDQITSQPVSNHWQALARASFREELDWQQRSLTSVILRGNKGSTDVDEMLETWFADSAQPLERWQHILADFRIGQTHEFAKFSVALRELMLLSLHCDPVN
ncbi:NAD-glutamate dehydrogenase [Colwellia sp. M166]|uniref:NAD-glutamate dehydrogenase n=1 Tax=Colwellia sp. M166 TaxID=2583805 RepID=UPI00211DCAA9|nr:NAD-glutamate dehydrogenase [Colwellia sp. M166]UUO22335.1 NAD-glutamate dehydrogenase [Colwellia sp. M166]|tara:strand:+ start:43951 stop:48795 length:4845 start_codon:yes stop_codon:yes gene_type:complete